ncbi:phosphatidylserine synthase [Salinarchaeum sp. Harcht-Bsk1]|nr:phosphatidylserine synthase [Salinarchaeum sp. Harcht-Bsk1]
MTPEYRFGMRPRFVGRTGLADAVTVANAILGFLAIVVATTDTWTAARLLLLAAILDGLDGVVARWRGGTAVGPYLDSLADVVSFAIAPAVLVYAVAAEEWGIAPLESAEPRAVVAFLLPALFVGAAITRLALYTAYDTDEEYTEGVQTTLAATLIGAAVLTGITRPDILLVITAAFVYLMLSPLRYPDLLARDALVMGVVHALAVLVPLALQRAFPWALLFLGLGYLVFGPWLYWRESFPLPIPSEES